MATLVSAATITTVVGTEISALGFNPGLAPDSASSLILAVMAHPGWVEVSWRE